MKRLDSSSHSVHTCTLGYAIRLPSGNKKADSQLVTRVKTRQDAVHVAQLNLLREAVSTFDLSQDILQYKDLNGTLDIGVADASLIKCPTYSWGNTFLVVRIVNAVVLPYQSMQSQFENVRYAINTK